MAVELAEQSLLDELHNENVELSKRRLSYIFKFDFVNDLDRRKSRAGDTLPAHFTCIV